MYNTLSLQFTNQAVSVKKPLPLPLPDEETLSSMYTSTTFKVVDVYIEDNVNSSELRQQRDFGTHGVFIT